MRTSIPNTNLEVSTVKLSQFGTESMTNPVWETCLFNTNPVRTDHKSAVVGRCTNADDAIKAHYAIVAALEGAYKIRNFGKGN